MHILQDNLLLKRIRRVFEEGLKATFTEFYDTGSTRACIFFRRNGYYGRCFAIYNVWRNSAEDAAKSEAEQLEALK